MAVPDGNGLRRLTIREGLRLFGYPEWYEIPTKESEAFDLLGNTVAIPVVEFVASKLADAYTASTKENQPISKEMPVWSLSTTTNLRKCFYFPGFSIKKIYA